MGLKTVAARMWTTIANVTFSSKIG